MFAFLILIISALRTLAHNMQARELSLEGLTKVVNSIPGDPKNIKKAGD